MRIQWDDQCRSIIKDLADFKMSEFSDLIHDSEEFTNVMMGASSSPDEVRDHFIKMRNIFVNIFTDPDGVFQYLPDTRFDEIYHYLDDEMEDVEDTLPYRKILQVIKAFFELRSKEGRLGEAKEAYLEDEQHLLKYDFCTSEDEEWGD